MIEVGLDTLVVEARALARCTSLSMFASLKTKPHQTILTLIELLCDLRSHMLLNDLLAEAAVSQTLHFTFNPSRKHVCKAR